MNRTMTHKMYRTANTIFRTNLSIIAFNLFASIWVYADLESTAQNDLTTNINS